MTKKWSQDYDSCIECDTTEILYKGHGMCNNCYSRWRRKQNPEKFLAYGREYENRPGRKERRKELYHKRMESPEGKQRMLDTAARYRARNKELVLERTRAWRDNNRDKIKEYNDARRDVILVQKYGEDALRKIMECGYKCQKCGLNEKRPAVHHVDWDESNNTYENFAILCGSCHSTLHSWQPPELRLQIFTEWMSIE